MKKQTMLLMVALAFLFAYASAHAQASGQAGQPNPATTNPADRPDASGAQQPGMQPNRKPMPEADASTTGTKPISSQDAALQSAVKDKLAANPEFANVQAAVDKGKVTLDGTVNSKADRKKAQESAKSVAGVRGVKNNIAVNGNEGQTEKKRQSSASAAGPGMGFFSAQDAAQGNASQNTAGSIAGNAQTSANPTSNAPTTAAPEAGGMGQSGTTPAATGRDTLTLQKQIETRIKNDPTLTDSTVSVNVSENAIELNGTVGSKKAKMNAERIAQSYAQNRKVTDNLQVTGAGNSDLNNGHSAMSNGQPTTPNTPKGTSPQMPQTDPQNNPQQDKSDQNSPR